MGGFIGIGGRPRLIVGVNGVVCFSGVGFVVGFGGQFSPKGRHFDSCLWYTLVTQDQKS